eukprot:319210-Amphidinium_carterae.1
MLALRRLRVRWFHCGASHMRQILETAGVSGPALREVDAVVQACSVCRTWQRPGPKAATTSRMTSNFNEEVQLDLLFYHPICDPTLQGQQ